MSPPHCAPPSICGNLHATGKTPGSPIWLSANGVQGNFLIGSLGVEIVGFVQSVGHSAFIGTETVSSSNSKLRASPREAFMSKQCIEHNPQCPYIPLVIGVFGDTTKDCRSKWEATAGAGDAHHMARWIVVDR